MQIARLFMISPLWLLLACATADDGVGRAAAPELRSDPSHAAHRLHTPLQAQLSGPAQVRQGDVVQLVLKLQRVHGQMADGSLALRLPPGVVLLGDDRAKARLSMPQAEQSVVTYQLRIDQVPSEDLFVEVDARGQGWGQHARLPYRFGRPTPLNLAPARSGRSVRVGSRDLGPAIEMP